MSCNTLITLMHPSKHRMCAIPVDKRWLQMIVFIKHLGVCMIYTFISKYKQITKQPPNVTCGPTMETFTVLVIMEYSLQRCSCSNSWPWHAGERSWVIDCIVQEGCIHSSHVHALSFTTFKDIPWCVLHIIHKHACTLLKMQAIEGRVV